MARLSNNGQFGSNEDLRGKITIASIVEIWREHFECVYRTPSQPNYTTVDRLIKANEVEMDIIRVLYDLLLSNDENEVWPDIAEIERRWLEHFAERGFVLKQV